MFLPGKTLALGLAGLGFSETAHPALYSTPGWRKASQTPGFAQAALVELFVVHSRNFDMDVDAVQERAGDPFLVLSDHTRRAGAGFGWGSVVSTWAGLHTIETFLYIFCKIQEKAGYFYRGLPHFRLISSLQKLG